MNNYMNNPMMDMFKKTMENPMAAWSSENLNKTMETFQNTEFFKNFNPANWSEISKEMLEKAPWLNNFKSENFFNFAENTKNAEAVADLHKLSLENAQAVLRRQAEIIQKHSTDLYKLMQNMVSSQNPEAAMSVQSDYMKTSFDALTADFKELLEMFAKANLENFEAASHKISKQFHKMHKASCCPSKEQKDDHACNSKKNSKK
ncbi:MAG: phasin family protein [Pseudomonadota bacterium]